MYGGHQTFDDAVVVVDDLGQGSETVSRAGGVGDLRYCFGRSSELIEIIRRTTLCEGSYLSRLTPQTYIGASAEGADMMTFFAPPFKWAEALRTNKEPLKGCRFRE